MPSESLIDEDRLSDFPESEASLIAKQAWSELLDRVANFVTRATIDLALPWHSVAEEIADLNFNIVTGQLNKRMKSCHPAKPWGSRDFFAGVGYHTHILEGYVPSPESLVIPSKPPPTE